MSQAKVIFVYEGREVIIQCIKDEKMKDICQKYVNKINKDINSLVYLYGGNQLNFNLNYNEQANIIDKERNIMKVLVYDNNEYIKKINDKLNNLININNEIKIKNENINNYIIAEIEIKDEDINKDIRIINSYEESLRINEYIKKNENWNN